MQWVYKKPSNFEFFQILYGELLELLTEPLGSVEHILDNTGSGFGMR